jgi:hypothetical protein
MLLAIDELLIAAKLLLGLYLTINRLGNGEVTTDDIKLSVVCTPKGSAAYNAVDIERDKTLAVVKIAVLFIGNFNLFLLIDMFLPNALIFIY